MVKRKRRKTKTRKPKSRKATRRPATRRRKTVRKKRTRKVARKVEEYDSPTKAVANNRKAHWNVYRDLQKKADKAWAKLRSDVKRKAAPHVIMEDRNNLVLLLGECNYLAGECMRMKYSHPA